MKVGIVVDGVSEYAAMPAVVDRLRPTTGQTYLRVIKADLQPLSPIPVMARSCQLPVSQLVARGADVVIVLVDRERTGPCAVTTAQELATEIRRRVDCRISVIVKDTCFENWLLADLAALRAQKKRFKVSGATTRAIEPNKADSADAAMLIRRAALGPAYDKVEDAKLILGRADPERMARHSRSFRKFLREAGHPVYRAQSRLPAE